MVKIPITFEKPREAKTRMA